MKPSKSKPLIATTLSFAIAAFSSGLAPYEAAAQTFAAPEPEAFAQPFSLAPDAMDGPAPLEIPAAWLASLPAARLTALPALKTNAALPARETAWPRFRKALAPISPIRDAAGGAYQAGRMFDRTGRRFAWGAEAVAVPITISLGMGSGLNADQPPQASKRQALTQRAAACGNIAHGVGGAALGAPAAGLAVTGLALIHGFPAYFHGLKLVLEDESHGPWSKIGDSLLLTTGLPALLLLSPVAGFNYGLYRGFKAAYAAGCAEGIKQMAEDVKLVNSIVALVPATIPAALLVLIKRPAILKAGLRSVWPSPDLDILRKFHVSLLFTAVHLRAQNATVPAQWLYALVFGFAQAMGKGPPGAFEPAWETLNNKLTTTIEPMEYPGDGAPSSGLNADGPHQSRRARSPSKLIEGIAGRLKRNARRFKALAAIGIMLGDWILISLACRQWLDIPFWGAFFASGLVCVPVTAWFVGQTHSREKQKFKNPGPIDEETAIMAVLRAQETRFWAITGVTGVGLGHVGNRPAIRIFFAHENLYQKALSDGYLPDEVEGYPVDYKLAPGSVSPTQRQKIGPRLQYRLDRLKPGETILALIFTEKPEPALPEQARDDAIASAQNHAQAGAAVKAYLSFHGVAFLGDSINGRGFIIAALSKEQAEELAALAAVVSITGNGAVGF